MDNIYLSIREKGESIELADQYDLDYDIFGKDHVNEYFKYIGVMSRTCNLLTKIPNFDVSLGFQNGMCSLVSRLRGKKCIIFDDNDYRISLNNSIPLRLFIKAQTLADHYIIPEACYDNFKKIMADDKLICFNGYKEDISLAGFNPDPDFLEKIPFRNYIVLRPEALDALYINTKSILSPLVDVLSKENINVVLLQRHKKNFYKNLYKENPLIYIPERAVNGLDLCYYSDGVLTGSGTMAREAACMGVTAVSFFPDDKLLSVDQQLKEEGKIFHSRDPGEIVNYILTNSGRRNFDSVRYESVRNNVRDLLENLLLPILGDVNSEG